MERKQNDLMLNLVANPTFSLSDFATVGLTADNTSLQSKEFYKNNSFIQKQFTGEDGKFNDKAFDQVYNKAVSDYNIMATEAYGKENDDFITYHRNDIFAPKEKRRQGPEFQQIIVSNPDRITEGLIRFGQVGERTKSRDELAQAEQVLLNPNEVYTNDGPDWTKAQWGKDPHNGFFDYFTDTLVMAQWDEEGDHIDPVTGQQTHHMKGDLKISPNGTYYYEKLDGRDIYGRRVLNKFNVFTEDGSTWNKYDFFDSDDIDQKSLGGNIIKNLALVGTMFLPYVGPVVVGASVATQLAGLMGTLGKMFTGSENPVFSELEGFAKSWNRQTGKTEYAQENTWCTENFVSLIGDVMGQLKEQRFFFEKIPAIFKGKYAGSEKSYNKLLEEYKKADLKSITSKISKIEQVEGRQAAQKAASALMETNVIRAQAELDSWIKGYNKIGEIFSKGYMTAITVGDTYGEAKAAGADDIDATILTLGYAAGEYAILNTGIGEWILPELRADRYKYKAIARALRGIESEKQLLLNKSSLEKIPGETKKEWFNKLFNIGKNIAKSEYVNGSRTLKASLAAGIGEGIEEVSEELLADVSKGIFNTVKWLRGNDDIRLDSFGFRWDDKGNREWSGKELFDRYGMSLVGGFVGGGLTNLGTSYRMGRQYNNMTSEQASQELVYMIRNNQLDDFYKTLDKMDNLGNKRLSATEFNEDGTYKPGTKENNQNEFAKKAIRQQVQQLSDLLNAEGISMSDSKFLDQQILSDLRFARLANAVTAGIFMDNYNKEVTDLVKDLDQLNNLTKQQIDTNDDGKINDRERHNTVTETPEIKKLKNRIKERREKIKDMIDGKNAYQFVRTTLFELSPLSSYFIPTTFPLYYEQQTGKKYSELTDEAERNNWRNKYEEWMNSDAKTRIQVAADIYFDMAQRSSELIKKHGDIYKKQQEQVRQIHDIVKLLSPDLINATKFDINPTDGTLSEISLTDDEKVELAQNAVNEYNIAYAFAKNLDPDKVKQLAEKWDNDITRISAITDADQKSQEELKLKKEKSAEILKIIENKINNIANSILNWGFTNTETKNRLTKLINFLQNYISRLNEDYRKENELSEDEITIYSEKYDKVTELLSKINKLPNTPLEQFVSQFSVNLGLDPINPIQLLEKANRELGKVSKDVSEFSMQEQTFKELNVAIATMEMFNAAINGAKVDNGGYDNIYGYNITLNEIAKKTGIDLELAEIDSNFANILINDSETNLKKLKFIRDLYKINSGQKLQLNEKVGILREKLFYKGLKNIIQIPDEFKDWKGINELKLNLEGLELLSKLNDNPDYTLTTEEKAQLENEKIKMRDLLYNFFRNNLDKIDSPQELSKLISKFDVYTHSDNLLNGKLVEIDGPSMIWELAATAAIKASDFYSIYGKVLDPNGKIAAIPTQEMAVFQNYAFILQRDIFSKFQNAYRYHIKNDWKNSSKEKRKNILKKLGNSDENAELLSEDKYAPYCFNFLPVPRFKAISLVEGIAGSGKSSGVAGTLIKMLNETHPDILKNVYVVHAASKNSAVNLQESIGLKDKGKALDKKEFMKEICPTPVEFVYNADGTVQIKDNIYELNSDKENKGKIPTSDKEGPSLIIIDEATHFNVLELDAIDEYAQKHGITVITMGDYDQLGISGTIKLTIENKTGDLQIQPDRNMFVRTMKLGLSMRTDNGIQTLNQQKFQYWMNQNDSETLQLGYTWNEEGLFGTEILKADAKFDQLTEDIKKLVEIVKNFNEGKSENEKEKIKFIYANINSNLYKWITDEANGVKDYFDISTTSSAQGSEGKFYVIDVSTFTIDKEKFNTWKKEVYTGLTRASQECIIATTNQDFVTSVKTDSIIKEPLLQESIQKFTLRKKEIYSQITGNIPEYKAPTKITIKQTKSNSGLKNGITPPNATPPAGPSTIQAKDSNNKLITPNSIVLYNGKYYHVKDIDDKGNVTIGKENISITVAGSVVTISEISYQSGETIQIGDIVTYNNEKYSIIDIIDDTHVSIMQENNTANIETVTIDSITKGDNIINQDPLDKNGNKLIINDIVLYYGDGYKVIQIYPNGKITIRQIGRSVNKEYTIFSSDVKVYYPEYTSGERMSINDVVTYKGQKAIIKDFRNIGNILIEFDNGTTQNVSDSELIKGYKNAPENVSIDLSSYDFKIGDKIDEYDSSGNIIDTFTIEDALIKRNRKVIHIRNKHNTPASISFDDFVSQYGTKYRKQTPKPPKPTIDYDNLPFEEGKSYVSYSESGNIKWKISIHNINSNSGKVYFQYEGDSEIKERSVEEFLNNFNKYNFQIAPEERRLILDNFDTNNDPITEDVVNENDLKDEIDKENKNSSESTKKNLLIKSFDKTLEPEMFLYTFNIFQYGRVIDNNGNIVEDSHSKTRIDCINGLYKIFEQSGNYTKAQLKRLDTYKDKLGDLYSAFANATDYEYLFNRIKSILGKDLQGNIGIDFGIKVSALNSTDNDYYNNPNPYESSKSESIEYNGSYDFKSRNIQRLKVVGIIYNISPDGSKKHDILEIPFASLSSPFSLISTEEGQKKFPDLYNIIKPFINQNIPNDKIVELAKQLKQITSRNKSYKYIDALLTIFLFKGNALKRISSEQFFGLNLQNLGSSFIQNAGDLALGAGIEYDQSKRNVNKWINIIDYANDPRITVTPVLKSTTGFANINGMYTDVAKKGHPFVLVSFDKTLTNTEDICNQYLKQLSDPNEQPKVALYYVLPPSTSLSNFVEYLSKKTSTPGQFVIGNRHTAFQILNILMNDPNFFDLVKNRNLYPQLEGKYSLMDYLQQAREIADTGSEEQLAAFLMTAVPDSVDENGTPSKNLRTVAGYFRKALATIICDETNPNTEYGEVNQEIAKIAQDILDKNQKKIFYNLSLVPNVNIGPFAVVKVDSNNQGLKTWTINGNPFQINGKIDPYRFKTDNNNFLKILSELADNINRFNQVMSDPSTKPQKNQFFNFMKSVFGDQYFFDKFTQNNASDTLSEFEENKQLYVKAVENILTKLNTLNIDSSIVQNIENQFNTLKNLSNPDTLIEDANEIVDNIYITLSEQGIIFVLIDGDTFISNALASSNNSIITFENIQDMDNGESEYIFETNTNGKVEFYIMEDVFDDNENYVESKKYRVEYDDNTKELTLYPINESIEQSIDLDTPRLEINEENFVDYISTVQRILMKLGDKTPPALKVLYNKTYNSLEEFFAKLKRIPAISNLEEILTPFISESGVEIESTIAKQLIEENKRNFEKKNKNKEESLLGACINPIKIKLI